MRRWFWHNVLPIVAVVALVALFVWFFMEATS